jgi:hypothetical protein
VRYPTSRHLVEHDQPVLVLFIVVRLTLSNFEAMPYEAASSIEATASGFLVFVSAGAGEYRTFGRIGCALAHRHASYRRSMLNLSVKNVYAFA